MLSTLGKIFSRQHFEIFFLFFLGKNLTFHAIFSIGDNLHAMSKSLLWEKMRKISNLSIAELAERLVKINLLLR